MTKYKLKNYKMIIKQKKNWITLAKIDGIASIIGFNPFESMKTLYMLTKANGVHDIMKPTILFVDVFQKKEY